MAEPYTDEELDHLARIVDEAWIHGGGTWSLARAVLDAGYRLIPVPEVRFGERRACTQAVELNDAGCLVDHDDKRRGRHCIGARNTPLRLVDAPEAVAVDG